MPTAARIISACCVAFIAWVVSGLAKQLLQLSDTGNFVPLSVVLGAVCGWVILGRRADRGHLGLLNAIGVGLTAVAMSAFWVLLIVSATESFGVAMERRFHDPMKVIYGIQPIFMRYGQALLDTTILVWLIAGGAITGILAHLAGQKWPGR
jgi:hypothetical protein